MELLDIHPICYLIRDLEYLRVAVLLKAPVVGDSWIYHALRRVRTEVATYKFREELLQEMDYWLRRLKKKYRDTQKLLEDDADPLYQKLIEWTRTLEDIFLNMKLSKLQTRGIINYPTLIDEGPRFFFAKTSIWNKLSTVSKKDLQDAGLCLLSGIPTPVVMLCLRVVEGVFRKYYKKKTGKKVDGKRWVNCIYDLRGKSNVNQTLIGHLDFVRKYERNPAQHPDKRFSQRQAENIFLRGAEIIEEMYEDFK